MWHIAGKQCIFHLYKWTLWWAAFNTFKLFISVLHMVPQAMHWRLGLIQIMLSHFGFSIQIQIWGQIYYHIAPAQTLKKGIVVIYREHSEKLGVRCGNTFATYPVPVYFWEFLPQGANFREANNKIKRANWFTNVCDMQFTAKCTNNAKEACLIFGAWYWNELTYIFNQINASCILTASEEKNVIKYDLRYFSPRLFNWLH